MFSVPAMSCSFFSSLQSRFWWMSACRLDVELQRVRFVTGVNDLSGWFLASDDFCVARCPLSPSQFVFAPSIAISQQYLMPSFWFLGRGSLGHEKPALLSVRRYVAVVRGRGGSVEPPIRFLGLVWTLHKS